jgi:hypothetical protein
MSKNITDKISFFLQEESVKNTKVTHPGILEVPEGKDVMTLGKNHFIKLAKKSGPGPIVKALLNLYRWNKNSNPKLSSWAKGMQEDVSDYFHE